MTKQENVSILRRVANGDQLAFSDFLNGYAGLVFDQAFRLLKSRESAEEVVQDVFMQVWRVRETLPAVNNIKNYLFVLAKGYTIDALRKLIRERKAFEQWKEQMPVQDAETDLAPYGSIIDQALKQLSPQQQKVWIMSRRLKMTYESIAMELGISRDAVNKYLQTANKNIIKYLRTHPELLVIALIIRQGIKNIS